MLKPQKHSYCHSIQSTVKRWSEPKMMAPVQEVKRARTAKNNNNPESSPSFFLHAAEFPRAPCFGPDPCSKLSCSFHGWPWFGAVGSLCLLNPGCAELPAGSERSPAGTLLSHPPAGTRLHFQPSLALLCVSALQPRQQSDREAEGRPESGQRKRQREASD